MSQASFAGGASPESVCEQKILRTLERFIPACKERHTFLRAACQFTSAKMKDQSFAELGREERANLLFYPLKLAADTREEQFVSAALDGIQNLLLLGAVDKTTKYTPPSVPQPPKKKSLFNLGGGGSGDASVPSPTPKQDDEAAANQLIKEIVFTICENRELASDDVHNQIVRTLLTAISDPSTDIHGNLLLYSIRTMSHIFCHTRSTPVQTSSRASLSQVVGIVISRMERIVTTAQRTEDEAAGTEGKGEVGAQAAAAEEDGGGDNGDSVVHFSGENERDCFLVLQRLCKSAMSQGDAVASPNAAAPLAEQVVRAKQLNLALVHHFIVSSGTNLRSAPSFILSLRKYVCACLMQNCVLVVPEATKIAYETLQFIMVEFRQQLKQQVKVFFQNILFPIIESENAAFAQKELVLDALNKFACHPQAVLDLFVNFDCVVGNPGIFEQLVNAVSKAVRRSHAVPNWVTPRQSDALKVGAISVIRSLLKSLVTFVHQHQPPPPEYGEEVLLREGTAEQLGEASQSPTVPTSAPSSPGPASPPAEESEIEKMRKSKKTYEAVIETFNTKKPMEGIDFALELSLIADESPKEVAKFLLTPGLDKVRIGEFLAANKPFPKDVLREFIDLNDFTNFEIDEAMRLFLGKFKIMGEAETVDRTMERFAERYCEQNPSVFSSAGTAYVLAFSIMMLNTDAHSPHVQKKMSLEEFIRNNRGIDDGKDLSQRFLTDIYNRITAREIKLEGEDGLKQARAPSSKDTQMTDMDKLFLSLEKKRQLQFQAENTPLQQQSLQYLQSLSSAQGGTSEVHHHADSVGIVQPMWEAIWTAVLPALSLPMEESDERAVIDACLEGIDEAMKLSCLFSTTTEREAFISTLATFTHLTSYREIHYKSVRAIQTILAIADREGDSLEGCWYEVLKCISLLDRLQLLVSERGPTTAVMSAQAYDLKRTERFNADMVSQFIDLVTIDRIITKSKNLGGRAVVHLVEQLCRVSAEELQENPSPRTYSLQKLVEVTELNIGRMRYVWSQMWTYLSAHFMSVGKENQELVAMYVVDSLRQLAMKFLERNELGNFNFQRDFLKPFEIIVAHSAKPKIHELVIASLRQMIEARARNIMSGWKIVIHTIGRCAGSKEVEVVSGAFQLLKLIIERYIHFVSSPELFSEVVIALAYFGENNLSSEIAFASVEHLSLCAAYAASGVPVNGLPSPLSGETLLQRFGRAKPSPGAPTAADDHVTKHTGRAAHSDWVSIFAALSSITNSRSFETRLRAVDAFFTLATEYGTRFSTGLWKVIVGRALFPVFDKLFGEILECHSQAEIKNDAYSGYLRLLERLLQGSLSLLSTQFEALSCLFGEFAGLMLSCGRKNDRKVSQLGFNALAEFLTTQSKATALHRPLHDEEWVMLSHRVSSASRSWLVIASDVLKSDAEGTRNINSAEANARVLSHLMRTLRSCMLSGVVPNEFFAPFQSLFSECFRLATCFFSDPLSRMHVDDVPSLQSVLLSLEKEASDCFIEAASRLNDDVQLMHWVGQVLARFVRLTNEGKDEVAAAERTVLLDILINVIRATLRLRDERFRALMAGIYDDLCTLIKCCDPELSVVLCSVFLRLGPSTQPFLLQEPQLANNQISLPVVLPNPAPVAPHTAESPIVDTPPQNHWTPEVEHVAHGPQGCGTVVDGLPGNSALDTPPAKQSVEVAPEVPDVAAVTPCDAPTPTEAKLAAPKHTGDDEGESSPSRPRRKPKRRNTKNKQDSPAAE